MRLICHNRLANENGKLNNIRPISINGVLFKILERVIMDELNKEIDQYKLISPSQIGFRRKVACDINVVRLRQKVTQLKEESLDGEEQFLLYIHLKCTYDSVVNQRLFYKMNKLNIS